jgi:hypothetical protein
VVIGQLKPAIPSVGGGGGGGYSTPAEVATAYEGYQDVARFTDTLATKLSGIEANATADMTAAEIATAYHTVANEFTAALKSKLESLPTNPVTTTALTGTSRSYTRRQSFTTATLTSASSLSWNLDNAQVARVTLSHNATLVPSNISNGATYLLYVKQDGTGDRTLSFNSSFDLGESAEVVISSAPNEGTLIGFVGIGGKLVLTGYHKGIMA